MKYFLFAIILLSAVCFSADNSALLKRADQIKSQQLQEFNNILAEVEQNAQTLTSYEENYLTLLKAYQIIYAGEPSRAIPLVKQVFESTHDQALEIRALTILVNLHGVLRNYLEGYKNAQRLLEVLPTASSNSKINAYAGLAIFYNHLGEYESGLKSATWLLENAQNPHTVCVAYQVKLEAEFYLKRIINPTSADHAINYCKKEKEYAVALVNLVIKAKIHANLENIDAAISLLERNQEIYENTHYPVAEADYHAQLAKLYFQKDQLDKAKIHADKAIKLSSGAGMFQSRVIAYEVLYQFYERVGDISQAHDAYKAFAGIEKALLDESKMRHLAVQKTQFEAQEKANHIALLNKENALLQSQAELRQREIDNSKLIITTLVLLATVAMMWLVLNRKMQRQLKLQAQTDELTGVANRHHFTQVAEKALTYHKKTRQHLSIIVFDLDLFKNVNDAYGHIVGDWALKAVVDTAQHICRKQDLVCRLGGEEFGILLPGCEVDKARIIAEKCRAAITAIDTSPSGYKFTLTASFGVVDTNLCGYQFEHLYAGADEMLYKSKTEGRNQIFVKEDRTNRVPPIIPLSS